jgi:magnesium chelatase subunit I
MLRHNKLSMAEEHSQNNSLSGVDISSDSSVITEVHSLKGVVGSNNRSRIPCFTAAEESGLAEALPFPFLALVGQREMKTALILALINPSIGGVLLIGPRGTGKTTAVRSLVDLLPKVPRSLCYYGCTPEDIEAGGIDAVCPDCARKFAQGEELVKLDSARLVELPLNARLEDVVGGMDERAAIQDRVRLETRVVSTGRPKYPVCG